MIEIPPGRIANKKAQIDPQHGSKRAQDDVRLIFYDQLNAASISSNMRLTERIADRRVRLKVPSEM